MVAVEAAAHGVPTIAFATGGIVDAVAEGESGRLIRPGDYGAFAGVVIESLANHLQLTESCRYFSERFAWHRFGESVAAVIGLATNVAARECKSTNAVPDRKSGVSGRSW